MLELRAAKVAIEDDHSPLDCFVTGQSWNGWECPYFTKEQGDALLKVSSFDNGRYDAEQDAFVFPCGSCGDECDCGPEVYEAIEVEGVKYYGIGAGMWIWSLAGEEDDEDEEPTDPWAGDFSRGAWHALRAFISRMWGPLDPSHPVLHRVFLAADHEEDEPTLRRLFADCLFAVREYGITISDQLRTDTTLAAAGGNPWAV